MSEVVCTAARLAITTWSSGTTPPNIEVKARVGSLEKLLPVMAFLAESEPVYVSLDDTFFSCPNGRGSSFELSTRTTAG